MISDCDIHILKDMSHAYKLSSLISKTPLEVFTHTPEKITVGVIKEIEQIGERDVFSVELDSKSVVKATRDAEFMLRSGKFRKTQGLKKHWSLMPLYLTSYTRKSWTYPAYLENTGYNEEAEAKTDQETFRTVARMVAEHIRQSRLTDKLYVSHKDKKQSNCESSNINIRDSKREALHHKEPKGIQKKLIDLQKVLDKYTKNHKIIGITKSKDIVYRVIIDGTFEANGIFVKGDN